MDGFAFYFLMGLVHSMYIFDGINFNGNCSFDVLRNVSGHINTCLIKYPDALKLYFSHAQEHLPLPEFIENRCSINSNLTTCVEKPMDDLKPCFESDFWQGLKKWKIVDEQVLSKLCEHNGEKAISIFKVEGKKCWDQGLRTVSNKCSNLITNLPNTLIPCRNFNRFKQCFISLLPQYCSTEATNFLQALLNIPSNDIC
ncbi:uncharacterized protein [Diabrotica undecimpunctata]|uniref:uncharacterized protein isoform X3 n=1 Tax=Diabrotica undecimpunctata TaxID=50387 RepID=UPI003B63BA53